SHGGVEPRSTTCARLVDPHSRHGVTGTRLPHEHLPHGTSDSLHGIRVAHRELIGGRSRPLLRIAAMSPCRYRPCQTILISAVTRTDAPAKGRWRAGRLDHAPARHRWDSPRTAFNTRPSPMNQ